MPSEPRIGMALDAITAHIERYRSAVVTTAEEVRGYLNSRSRSEPGATGVAASLGQLGGGWVDVGRFSGVVADGPADDPATREQVERAFDVLRVISAGEDDLFELKLKPGARLRDAVGRRLSEMGRAFAAARVAGMAAGGRTFGGDDGLLNPLAFGDWGTAERAMAPGLVVELDGADLHAGDLSEFLDGAIKIVLVVRGDMAPAPLARLITPGVFVLQTTDGAGLDRFAAAQGPAVAALVSASAATFVHDPAAGTHLWQRIEILSQPDQRPRRWLAGFSAAQQAEELDQLRAMAAGPEAAAVGAEPAGGPAEAARPVDRLAAWLLNQADLKDLE